MSSRGVNIRRATREDLPHVAAVHRASIQRLCAQHYSTAQLYRWTEALRPEGYAALLGTHEFLVADHEGEVVGFGILDPGEALINAIYVSPKWVRRGVGGGLLKALEASARKQGSARLRLSSTLNAVPFYAHFGYLQLGPGANRLPTGVELPCVLMTKDLTATEPRRAGSRSPIKWEIE